MDDVRIALAGPERIGELEPVYGALYEHHVAVSTWHPGPERGAAEAWRRRRGRYEKTLSAPGGILLVAERDGRIVGALVGEIEDHAEVSDTYDMPARQAHVHDLAVLAGARGGGVGRALMERFEEELRARDVPWYGLDVMAGNEQALRFYTSMGLEPAAVSLDKRLRA
jgi:ribosomal protein S18 acetylase RimI-like enzyme